MNYTSIPTSDLKKIIKLFARKIGILFVCFAVLYLESTFFAEKYNNGQIIANVLGVIGFVVLYSKSVKRTKKLMIYIVIIGFLAEYFFSIYLDMYSYRLGKIPFWVPFGHAILYIRIFAFSKASLVKKYHKIIEYVLYDLITIIALGYLCFFNDVFGFVLTLGVFLISFLRPKERLLFLTMYLIAVLLEFLGVFWGIWGWPDTAFGIFGFLPSHNPPSGIGILYFIIPAGSFIMYAQLNNKVWERVKRIRSLNKLKRNGKEN